VQVEYESIFTGAQNLYYALYDSSGELNRRPVSPQIRFLWKCTLGNQAKQVMYDERKFEVEFITRH
jgi:hypothetical protein